MLGPLVGCLGWSLVSLFANLAPILDPPRPLRANPCTSLFPLPSNPSSSFLHTSLSLCPRRTTIVLCFPFFISCTISIQDLPFTPSRPSTTLFFLVKFPLSFPTLLYACTLRHLLELELTLDNRLFIHLQLRPANIYNYQYTNSTDSKAERSAPRYLVIHIPIFTNLCHLLRTTGPLWNVKLFCLDNTTAALSPRCRPRI